MQLYMQMKIGLRMQMDLQKYMERYIEAYMEADLQTKTKIKTQTEAEMKLEMEADTKVQIKLKIQAEDKVGHINLNNMGEEVDMDQKGGSPEIVPGVLQGVAYSIRSISINRRRQGSHETGNRRRNREIIRNLGVRISEEGSAELAEARELDNGGWGGVEGQRIFFNIQRIRPRRQGDYGRGE